MAIDPQHPGDLGRDLLVEFGQGAPDLFELGAALGQEHRLPGVEEYFGLEYEAVADDADVRPVAENGAQPSEELRAITRQFLNALCQRDVQALTEVGDAVLRFLVTL